MISKSIGLAAVVAAGLTGCASPSGLYGAQSFVRIGDTNGLPTYKATGHTDNWLLAAEPAQKLMMAACPDGHPVLIDGMSGMNLSNWYNAWWWAIFTCEHEIALKG